MRVLVVNAGSSSLKLRLLGPADELEGSADLPASDGHVDPAALRDALASLGDADAVGHRVVHGGARYRAAARVDGELVRALDALTPLAPLHQPAALAAMAAVGDALPQLPAVACFDTAFGTSLPAAAATYALPAAWRERFELRRHGFHGLSHAWVGRHAAALTGARRIVSCHLGAGASLAAVRDGRCADTTMGFTPLEGLVMATRSGSVDPGLILWLVQHGGLEPAAVERGLDRESGLLGLAGSADMAAVVERRAAGDAAAALAFDVYVHRLRALIATMAAALGGLDALVFTGGVGEHAPAVRAAAADGLGFLGVALDPAANATAVPDAELTAASAAVRTLVLTAREDLEIARQVRALAAMSR